MSRFSERHGFVPAEADITVRNDAPHELRGVIVDIGYESGFDPHSLRSLVAGVLRVREDPGNWSAFPNVDGEVRDLLDSCEWYEVYDAIEEMYATLANPHRRRLHSDPERFETELNKYFRRRGIGWRLQDGRIEIRGEPEFEKAVKETPAQLEAGGRPTAAKEIREALLDLSRRPTPDTTGAIQHALAAVETVARDVTGDSKATLGALLGKNPNLVPSPLDVALEKLWGFASEQGRHLREGREPSPAEAELAVLVAAAVARYLNQKTA